MHAPSGVRIYEHSVLVVEDVTLERAATVVGTLLLA
jgi:hypothetical protein